MNFADQCSRDVLEVVPFVMRGIRAQLRKYGAKELSVPQFRTLVFLSRHEGASLSEVAEHIGMTLPSMSGMIDGLVNRHLAIRQTHPTDRRRMILTLTNQGQTTLKTARAGTQSHLAGLFGHLSQSDCATVTKAMRILRPLFSEVA